MKKTSANTTASSTERGRGLTGLLCVFFFALLTLALFREGWLAGKVIQGIDGNFSQIRVDRISLIEGLGGIWDSSRWLGSGRAFDINLYNAFLRIFPAEMVAFGGYSLTIFVCALFTWLLLLRLGAGNFAAVFGAISFSLAPHFVTLVFPGHIFAVYGSALAAILFYFVTALLDGKTSGWRAWLCMPAAGFGWGMLMNSDVQRGLYFSVAVVAYALFLIFRDVRKPAEMLSRSRLVGLASMIAVGVFTLLLFAHNAQLQFGSELVSGKVAGVQEESAESDADRWAFATSWSFHPKELIDSLAPGYHGMLSGDPERPYWGSRPVAHSNDGLGYFVLFFGLAGVVTGFRASGLIRFFSVMTLLATLLAFGEYWPGRPLFSLWYQLPMMDKMRAPVKFMSVAAFGLAILSAFGFRHLLEALKENRQAELKKWRIAFGVVTALAGFGFISAMAGDGNFPAKLAQSGAIRAMAWMGAFSVAGLVLITISLRQPLTARMTGLIGGAFIFLLIVNLFQINRFYITRAWFEPAKFYQVDEAIQFLQQNSQQSRVTCSFKMMYQGRMIPLSILATRDFYVTHLFQYFGIDAMEHTPQSRVALDHESYFKALLPEAPASGSAARFAGTLLDGQIRFWRQSGVRYIMTDGNLYGISPQPVPVFDLMRQHPALNLVFTGKAMGGQPVAIFELKDYVPVLAIVPAAVQVSDREASLAQIQSASFNPQTSTVIADADVSAGGTGTVSVLQKSPGMLRLSVESDAPSVLRWLSRYDEGWKAQIDGMPIDLFPADYLMTGLSIPAGRHALELRYVPAGSIFRFVSFWLSISGAFCVIVATACNRADSISQ